MSKAVNSPTGRLLRSSRFFAVPRGLPAPQVGDPSAQGVLRASDSATLPYPTHQAIATPAASNARGDWGLKRPLPAKSTRRTSTPVVRVHHQDTYEHITDFASASDHVLNERKWAEMGIPMVQRSKRDDYSSSGERASLSVYEDWLDNTEPTKGFLHGSVVETPTPNLIGGRNMRSNTSDTQAPHAARQRWKFKGPWIAGMQEGEFASWLKKTLSSVQRDGRWTQFLSDSILEKRLAQARQRARDDGEMIDEEEAEGLKVLLRPSKSEQKVIMKELRDDHVNLGLSSELTGLICEFLDLPGVKPPQSAGQTSSRYHKVISNLTDAGSLDQGPPSTHPGAGLSYIRSNAWMENHPVHGPQAQHSPVLARVLRARTSLAGPTRPSAILGVGGFVGADAATGSMHGRAGAQRHQPSQADGMGQALDPDVKGGNKVWVHPEKAVVDENGRIVLETTRGDHEAIAVKKEDVDEIHSAKAAGNGENSVLFAHNPMLPRMQQSTADPQRKKSSQDTRLHAGQKRLVGFDADSGVQSDDTSNQIAVKDIQGILERGARETLSGNVNQGADVR